MRGSASPRGWWWFYRRFGLIATMRYWGWGQRHGWLRMEDFPAWLRAHGFDVPKEWKAVNGGKLTGLTRRERDQIYRDTREALRFSQRAFNEGRYADAALWASKASAKANRLSLSARDEA